MEIAKGFRGSGRYKGSVRAARAYLAGFGTTGSLLAGAALMFIVASALVAFRGWPHVATAPSPGEVVVSSHPASSTGTAAAPAAGAGAPLPPGASRRGLAGRGQAPAGPPRRTIGPPASTSAPVAASG